MKKWGFMSLTDRQIKSLKPCERPYKAYDGKGLYLNVLPSGVRSWYYRYKTDGREKKISLGHYPAVTLADARERAAEMRGRVRTGIDPSTERRAAVNAIREREQHTFQYVAQEWQQLNDKGISEVTRRVRRNDCDWLNRQGLGRIPAGDITTPYLYELIRSARERRGEHVAARLLSVISRIMQFAVMRGIVTGNPARELGGVFVLPPSEGRRMIPPELLSTFFRELEGYTGSFESTRLALHLLILTFVRPGELCAAEWSEFDMDRRLWLIPAWRMKKRREHVVPLSEQAVGLLERLKELAGDSGFVFPSVSRAGHLMRNSLNAAMQRMKFRGIATPHGFRALASSTLNENGFTSDVIERQLAHVERNRVRAAYNRAEYLDERTRMMQWYADYIDQQRSK